MFSRLPLKCTDFFPSPLLRNSPLSRALEAVRDGICVDPPLCRGPSQGVFGLRFTVLVCEGETVGKMGEVDEMGERELVPWSVSGAARNET